MNSFTNNSSNEDWNLTIENRMNQFSITKRKKKIYVKDGLIKYPISISDKKIECLCSKYSNTPPSTLCDHIHYFLYKQGLDLNLLKHWSKMKEEIITQIISSFSNNYELSNKDLWKYAQDNIFDADCLFCLDKIKMNYTYNVCLTCQIVLHSKCDKKWRAKNDICMHCKQ